MKKQIRSLLFLAVAIIFISLSLHAHEKEAPRFGVSLQPLHLLNRKVTAGLEYPYRHNISFVVPVSLGITWVPFSDSEPGWKVVVGSGFDVKVHLTGSVFGGGFYLQPGIGLSWRNHIDPYEGRILAFLALSRVGAYLIESTYKNESNFLHTGIRFMVGYDWFFDNGISIDLNVGMLLSNVFALGSKKSGWFYLLPVPAVAASVGFIF